MDMKFCVLDDEKQCDNCGECLVCDLDPSKTCDNCMKCVDDGGEDGYKKMNVGRIVLEGKDYDDWLNNDNR